MCRIRHIIYFRFYSVGVLKSKELVRYVETHGLMYEYYRQAQEIVPPHVSNALHRLFTSEAYQIVNSRYIFFSRVNQLDLNRCIYIFRYIYKSCEDGYLIMNNEHLYILAQLRSWKTLKLKPTVKKGKNISKDQ